MAIDAEDRRKDSRAEGMDIYDEGKTMPEHLVGTRHGAMVASGWDRAMDRDKDLVALAAWQARDRAGFDPATLRALNRIAYARGWPGAVLPTAFKPGYGETA